jgi:hypothetical protein
MSHPCTVTGKTVVLYILIFTALECILGGSSFQTDYDRVCHILLCGNFIMHLFRISLLFSVIFSNYLLHAFVTTLLLTCLVLL